MAAPFCFNLGLEWHRHQIQKEMKEELKKGMLSSISLNEKDIHWFRSGKEIVIDGHLFDVEEMVKGPSGQITIKGLFDTKETALNKLLDKQQKEQDQKNSRQLARFFSDWQAIPVFSEEPIALFIERQKPSINTGAAPVSAYSAILKPPPQA